MTLIRIVNHFDRALVIEQRARFCSQSYSLYTKMTNVVVKYMRLKVPEHAARKGEIKAEDALFRRRLLGGQNHQKIST